MEIHYDNPREKLLFLQEMADVKQAVKNLLAANKLPLCMFYKLFPILSTIAKSPEPQPTSPPELPEPGHSLSFIHPKLLEL